jgi:hypothetical protein
MCIMVDPAYREKNTTKIEISKICVLDFSSDRYTDLPCILYILVVSTGSSFAK